MKRNGQKKLKVAFKEALDCVSGNRLPTQFEFVAYELGDESIDAGGITVKGRYPPQ